MSIFKKIKDFGMKTLLDGVWIFLAKKIKPFSGTLLSIIVITLSIWSFAQESLFDFLCGLSESFTFLVKTCNIGETKFYSIMLGLVGVLITLREKLEKLQAKELKSSGVDPEELVIGGIDAPIWLWAAGILAVAFIVIVSINAFPQLATILVFGAVIAFIYWGLNKLM